MDVTNTPEASRGVEYDMDNTGNMIPVKTSPEARVASHSTTRYTYQYDDHGNWTEKVSSMRSAADSEFKVFASERRTLTYY